MKAKQEMLIKRPCALNFNHKAPPRMFSLSIEVELRTYNLGQIVLENPKTRNYNRNTYKISVNTPIPPYDTDYINGLCALQ